MTSPIPHTRQTRRSPGVLAACLSLWLLAGPSMAGDFVPGTGDLPLMPGLSITQEAVAFDQPDGRIVEVAAEGAASVTQIGGFYAQTLPQLGWTATGDGQWRRGAEVLGMQVRAAASGRASVRFLITPAPDRPQR